MTIRRLRMALPPAARGSATAFGLFLILVVLVLAGAIIEGGDAMSAHAEELATSLLRDLANPRTTQTDPTAARDRPDRPDRTSPRAAKKPATSPLARTSRAQSMSPYESNSTWSADTEPANARPLATVRLPGRPSIPASWR